MMFSRSAVIPGGSLTGPSSWSSPVGIRRPLAPGPLELGLADLAGRESRVAKVEGRVDRPVRHIAGECGPVLPQFDLAPPPPVRTVLGQPLGFLPLVVREAKVDAVLAEKPATGPRDSRRAAVRPMKMTQSSN